MTFYSLFKQQAALFPHKTALVVGELWMSYARLLQSVEELIVGFNQKGYAKGTVIALAVENCIEHVHLLLAASATGVTLVSLHAAMKQEALLRAIESSQATVLIAHAAQLNALDEDSLPSIKTFAIDSSATLPFHVMSFHGLYRQRSMAIQTAEAVDGAFILCLTSGSTGDPKPIELSQATKLRRARGAAHLYAIDASAICLVSTPLHHSLAQRFTLLPLISGATCVVLPTFTAEKWLQAVDQHQVTFSIAVSSQLKALLSLFESAPQKLASLKTLVSSSARLPEETRERLLACLQCDFHECYGTSEMGIVSNIQADDMHISAQCVGFPVLEAKVRILSTQGEILPANQVGEIACLSETAFTGYYQLEAATKNAYHDHYFLTGDLGKLDEAGRLYYLGRTKELIKIGGISVYPKDIEDALMGIEGVADHCAVGVNDDKLGEVIALAYTLKQEAGLSSQAIKRQIKMRCLQTLSDYQIPYYYVELDAFPYTPLGKLQKNKVKEIVIARITPQQPA